MLLTWRQEIDFAFDQNKHIGSEAESEAGPPASRQPAPGRMMTAAGGSLSGGDDSFLVLLTQGRKGRRVQKGKKTVVLSVRCSLACGQVLGGSTRRVQKGKKERDSRSPASPKGRKNRPSCSHSTLRRGCPSGNFTNFNLRNLPMTPPDSPRRSSKFQLQMPVEGKVRKIFFILFWPSLWGGPGFEQCACTLYPLPTLP